MILPSLGLFDGLSLEYRNQISMLVKWCTDNNLELNVMKTKEIIIDFRKNPTPVLPLSINGTEIDIVTHFKFLGVNISNDLKWDFNTDQIVAKAQQRLYFLRRLKSFHVSTKILIMFYRAVVESILTQSITVWFGHTSAADRKRLGRVIKYASRIIGHEAELATIEELYHRRVIKRSKAIIKDEHHPANSLFRLMPHNKRYASIATKTNRFLESFFPTAVRSLNALELRRPRPPH